MSSITSTDTTSIAAMTDRKDRQDGTGREEWRRRPWVIVGCGRLGRLLGLAANHLDIPLRATWNRTEEAAERTRRRLGPEVALAGDVAEQLAAVDLTETVVWLTVVDDAIEAMADEIAGDVPEGSLLLHGCGSLDASVLRAGSSGRPTVGSVHPLLAITDPERALERSSEVVWTVEGDRQAVAFGRAFIDALGGQCVELASGTRALYHASASTAANLVVALIDAALQMAELAGLTRQKARQMLLPLVVSAVDNLREASTEDALSGPAARGDEGTIKRHREALADRAPELLGVYDALTERARELADRRGE